MRSRRANFPSDALATRHLVHSSTSPNTLHIGASNYFANPSPRKTKKKTQTRKTTKTKTKAMTMTKAMPMINQAITFMSHRPSATIFLDKNEDMVTTLTTTMKRSRDR